MADHSYTIVLTPEPDGSAYNVTVPSLPGCLTWGPTVDAALAMAEEAIVLWIESLAAHHEPVPIETESPQLHRVTVETPKRMAIGA